MGGVRDSANHGSMRFIDLAAARVGARPHCCSSVFVSWASSLFARGEFWSIRIENLRRIPARRIQDQEPHRVLGAGMGARAVGLGPKHVGELPSAGQRGVSRRPLGLKKRNGQQEPERHDGVQHQTQTT